MIPAGLVSALRRAAGSDAILVASDYDGTLADIVDDPSLASPNPAALNAMQELGRLPGVHSVIVSGRSRDTLRRLTGAPEGVMLVGTHGAETPGADFAAPADVAALVGALERVTNEFTGTVLEAKPAGAALHYRHAHQPERAAAAARDCAARFQARVIEGKRVVEVLLSDADKGKAIAHLRQALYAPIVVFFGDDVTDEDVFAVMSPEDVSVKVGQETSLARYRVADPAAVAEALASLLAARRAVN